MNKKLSTIIISLIIQFIIQLIPHTNFAFIKCLDIIFKENKIFITPSLTSAFKQAKSLKIDQLNNLKDVLSYEINNPKITNNNIFHHFTNWLKEITQEYNSKINFFQICSYVYFFVIENNSNLKIILNENKNYQIHPTNPSILIKDVLLQNPIEYLKTKISFIEINSIFHWLIYSFTTEDWRILFKGKSLLNEKNDLMLTQMKYTFDEIEKQLFKDSKDKEPAQKAKAKAKANSKKNSPSSPPISDSHFQLIRAIEQASEFITIEQQQKLLTRLLETMEKYLEKRKPTFKTLPEAEQFTRDAIKIESILQGLDVDFKKTANEIKQNHKFMERLKNALKEQNLKKTLQIIASTRYVVGYPVKNNAKQLNESLKSLSKALKNSKIDPKNISIIINLNNTDQMQVEQIKTIINDFKVKNILPYIVLLENHYDFTTIHQIVRYANWDIARLVTLAYENADPKKREYIYLQAEADNSFHPKIFNLIEKQFQKGGVLFTSKIPTKGLFPPHTMYYKIHRIVNIVRTLLDIFLLPYSSSGISTVAIDPRLFACQKAPWEAGFLGPIKEEFQQYFPQHNDMNDYAWGLKLNYVGLTIFETLPFTLKLGNTAGSKYPHIPKLGGFYSTNPSAKYDIHGLKLHDPILQEDLYWYYFSLRIANFILLSLRPYEVPLDFYREISLATVEAIDPTFVKYLHLSDLFLMQIKGNQAHHFWFSSPFNWLEHKVHKTINPLEFFYYYLSFKDEKIIKIIISQTFLSKEENLIASYKAMREGNTEEVERLTKKIEKQIDFIEALSLSLKTQDQDSIQSPITKYKKELKRFLRSLNFYISYFVNILNDKNVDDYLTSMLKEHNVLLKENIYDLQLQKSLILLLKLHELEGSTIKLEPKEKEAIKQYLFNYKEIKTIEEIYPIEEIFNKYFSKSEFLTDINLALNLIASKASIDFYFKSKNNLADKMQDLSLELFKELTSDRSSKTYKIIEKRLSDYQKTLKSNMTLIPLRPNDSSSFSYLITWTVFLLHLDKNQYILIEKPHKAQLENFFRQTHGYNQNINNVLNPNNLKEINKIIIYYQIFYFYIIKKEIERINERN